MNHQPFEEWLLSEEKLTSEQESALSAHLDDCEQCARLENAWDAVLVELHRAEPVAPRPGFGLRFEARLEAERAMRQRRWTLLGLLAFSLGAIIFSLVVIAIRWDSLPSPIQLLTGLVFSLTSTTARLGDAVQYLGAVIGPVPLVIPLFLWVGFTVSLLLWGFVWLLGVWRLPKTMRSGIR